MPSFAMEEDDNVLDFRLFGSFEKEMNIVHDLVVCVKESRGALDCASIKKVQTIIEKYQEQGQLLEPHLEGIISPLMETLQSVIAEAGNVADADLNVVKRICSIVHTLMTVCGYKTVVKFFPHQVCDLEVTVTLLERCHQEGTVSSILKEESTGDWETQCTLLLWLSILVLIPFDMASIDTAWADSGSTENSSLETIPPLVERIIKICKCFLASPGPVREMTGVLLAHLLSRPDMRPALRNFVDWTREALSNVEDSRPDAFLIPGIVGVLTAIFKVGGRDILLSVTPAVWDVASQLVSSTTAGRSPLLRKLLVKLIQRIGLVHLPPKAASWRYMQVGHSLVQNLASRPVHGGESFSPQKGGIDACTPQVASLSLEQSHKQIEEFTVEAMEKNIHVPEIIEEVIDQQLNGLRDKVTVVRWSAAKGVGRVTGRLSLTLADDVVASVLELFKPTEGDGAWHGGCLALAELARRGLLLPERLSKVVPVIVQALHYEVRRGPHSVGSHVRDAAAYVTWAFARAYSPALMKQHLGQIAPALLTIACYDREVNCRRAAAAAFQEFVGRQGDYDHGIDVVTAADYFSLGIRSHSYRVVAVYVAQFLEYRLPLIEELLKSKLSHWDKAVRELAAEALFLLVKYDPSYFEGFALDTLVPWTLSADLCQRHGATLAIAEIISALHECGCQLSSEKEQCISGVVPAIEKARLYRGKGGEIMRAAVSRLIECTATVRVPLLPRIQKILLDSIDENLRHPSSEIQACAVAALKGFVQGYLLPGTGAAVARTTSKYIHTLRIDNNPAAKRGAALALGALPFELLAPVWKDVVDALCNALIFKGSSVEEDAETRVNAIRGLSSVCETICLASTHFELGGPVMVVRRQVVMSLLEALDDYAIDNRGDVGSWVREAAMEGIERCTYILCQQSTAEQNMIGLKDGVMLSNASNEVFNEEIGVQVIGGLAKQAVEKIDRVRDVAGRILQRLLHTPIVPACHIPHREELKQMIENDPNVNWAAPGDSFPRLVQLLRFPEYRRFLLSGLVISIGGLAHSLCSVSASALVDFLGSTYDVESSDCALPIVITELTESPNLAWLGGGLAQVLMDYAGNDRVVIPAFKTIDVLFNRGVFSESRHPGDCVSKKILNLIEAELRGCRDVVKLLAGVTVLSHFASLQWPSRGQSILQLLNLLFHRYPKVRRSCAEQLYLLLLQTGDELVGCDSVNIALEVIGETCWDGDVESITADRDLLYSFFHLQPSPRQPPVTSNSKGTMRNNSVGMDENDNYSALVDAAGY